MKTMEEENDKFKEQYTTDTVRNTETLLDMINLKIEESQGISNEKFEKVLRSKEDVEEKKKMNALVDKVSILLESVEKQIVKEKQSKEDTAFNIETLKHCQQLAIMAGQ